MSERIAVNVRPLVASDYKDAGRIFLCAVHEGTRGVHSREQRLAWGGETIDLTRWKAGISGLTGFVAEEDGDPVGFFTIDETDYIDLAFVLPSVAGRGVGRLLLNTVERWARGHGAKRLTTDASMAAHPFFETNGWSVLEEEIIYRKGVTLKRYKMQKDIS